MSKSDFYWRQVSRNIGWITKEDQVIIKNAVVGIAGCGGMGGLVAVILVRLGVKEVRIADNECFDISNLNRQYAANMRTLGLNKALSTARMLGLISKATTIIVYPDGIKDATVDVFTKGCDIICDEIEFFALWPRYILHKAMRKYNSVILNSPTIGHCWFVTKFTKDSMTIEELWEMTPEEVYMFDERIRRKITTQEQRMRIVEAMLRLAAPEIPEYSAIPALYSTAKEFKRLLIEEIRASVVSTNPPMASGLLANQILFFLLEKSAIPRLFVTPPPMPGYLMFDAGLFICKKVDTKWW